MPEQAKGNTDLNAYISEWLAKVLELKKGITPVLTKAYDLGRANNPTRIYSRGLSLRSEFKKKLEVTKEKGSLKHFED